jgi:glycine/D-amino acid oxidase-like deaminating enzyme
MHSDILIIGGGIAGVSAAAALAPLGSVMLLEAEPHLAHHASGRSAAMYEPHYGNPAVVALSLASGDALRAADVLSPRGLLIVAGEGERATFEAEAQGMNLAPIHPDDALACVPILNRARISLAAHADHAWDIDTDRLIQSLARTARAAGVTFHTSARATAIARDDGLWRVTTSAGDHTAQTIVNASGAWADDIARIAGLAPLGLVPHRRSMARIPAPGGHEVWRWPMTFGAGETFYFKPDAGALIVSPAEEDPMEPQDAWADDMVLAEGLARYEAFVTEPVTRLLASWAGLRTFSPDRVPVIGRDPTAPDFFWLAGQGGYGFQSAPAIAKLTADLLGGQTPDIDTDLVARLAPDRFRR